ncbi:Helix-turn-helix type 11 domain-containing protein [Methanocaldococcus villosus KIN24-T80]|uniref:Helix-turn-helix type 11 domain-containing protein n=1 Tax=Methanocaldococcus villosus KIN24-T80 TaxID=1069083 RepID=N6VSE6_9EURY|nr:helix-turn-helix domain-containing protein [Methanocaldococcus villosus]ENN96800.1 Helix-turn-helix type 11 domain-containing protein [Methanocaldococcus villosus KIN24-T80]
MNIKEEIEKLVEKKEYDFWTFLKKAYEKDIKLDIGHFILLNLLIGVKDIYKKLINEIGEEEARKILEKNRIFTKNSDYVSGEFLKNYINRKSRVAVHNRIKDLKTLGFKIESKSGPFGGYKLIEYPEWFKKE